MGGSVESCPVDIDTESDDEIRNLRLYGRDVLPYGPGTAFGYEPMLHEAGVWGLAGHEAIQFKCCHHRPCSLFALRYGALVELNSLQPEVSQMVQEVLADTIVGEARRRRRQIERLAERGFRHQTLRTSARA